VFEDLKVLGFVLQFHFFRNASLRNGKRKRATAIRCLESELDKMTALKIPIA
jgi:hypothetical protein